MSILGATVVNCNDIQTISGLPNRGRIIQVVNSTTTTSIEASASIFVGTSGGTTPTSTSGTQYHSFSFTPSRSDSTILINSTNLAVSEVWNYSDLLWVAAFAGTSLIVASSCAVAYYSWGGAYNATFVNLVGSIASWGTSARTISIRFGVGATSGGGYGYGVAANNYYGYNAQGNGARDVNFQMMEVAP